MAISLKHTTLTTESPTGPGGTITAAEWDEAHDLQMAADRLLGRTTTGAGAVEEISIGTGLSMASGVLSASGGGSSGWTQIATSGTLSGTSYSFTSIPTTYGDLIVVINGMSHNNGSTAQFRVFLENGVQATSNTPTFSGSVSASTVYYGAMFFPHYNQAVGMMTVGMGTITNVSDFGSPANTATFPWRITNGFNIITFQPSAGSFDAGTLTLYGR